MCGRGRWRVWRLVWAPDRTVTMTRSKLIAVLAMVAVAVGLVACGDDGPDLTTPTATVTVTLRSAENRLSTVGPQDRVVYGWNLLVGTGEGREAAGSSNVPVEVEMLGNVAYLDGNGEFFGFVTFVFDDGDSVATRMIGEARSQPDTSDAVFEADLEVLGGTGRFDTVTGTGTFTGSRTAALGGAVDAGFELRLAGLADPG